MNRIAKGSIVALAVLLLARAPARADLTFGYDARYVGMGGAGLALIDDPTQASMLNPAALSLRTGFGIQWPNISARWRGAGLDDVLNKGFKGGTASQAEDLARSFAKEPTRLDIGLGLGLLAGPIGLRGTGQVAVNVIPGAGFTTWANSGQSFASYVQNTYAGEFANFAAATNQAQLQAAIDHLNQVAGAVNADVVAAAFYGPSIGVGFKLPVGQDTLGDMRVGVRAKQLQCYYSHWNVAPSVDPNTLYQFGNGGAVLDQLFQATPAAEMNGRDEISKSSLGFDAGVIWQPKQISNLTLAATIDNLIEPSFTIPGNASAAVAKRGEKLLPRTINLGAAYKLPAGLTVAADMVDLTGANNTQELRVGAELRPNLPMLNWIALRAGYASNTGGTLGLGLGSVGIAYGKRAPLVATQSFNF